MSLKKLAVYSIIALLCLMVAYPAVSGLTVSYSTSNFGFDNGYYVSFASGLLPMTFLTPIDGGQTHLNPSNNGTYPSFMFFQQQGSSSVYGFYASGCNVVINTFFSGNVLEFGSSSAGTVEVYVGSLGPPESVVGATGTFNVATNVATLTIPAGTQVQLNFGPSPSPTPTPPPPIGGNSSPSLSSNPVFNIDSINLGVVQLGNKTVGLLKFTYTGNSQITITSLKLSSPFQEWITPDNFSKTYQTNSGQITLTFVIPANAILGAYKGSITLYAEDNHNQYQASNSIKIQIGGTEPPNYDTWLLYGAVTIVAASAIGLTINYLRKK